MIDDTMNSSVVDQGRHFILTNGRSGRNYFVQARNKQPQIANYGEVLGDWTLAGKYVRPRFGHASDYLETSCHIMR